MACGRVNNVRIHIQPTDVPEQFLEMDYRGSSEMRIQFQEWLNERWKIKDDLLEKLSQ